MNYTKGEWKKEGNKVKVFGRGTIAICPSPTDDEGVLEFVANAHIIAAAPSHHELLKWIRDRLEHFGNLDTVRDEEIVEQLDIEIAKAGGK